MPTVDQAHFPRRITEVIARRLAEEPVVVLTGPRTVGNSTLLHEVAVGSGRDVIDLDDLNVRSAVAGDPTLVASGPAPVLIDEYQKVPELLDAIKAELGRGLTPGRFVLAGSTRYETLPRAAQSLTGRAHVMTIYPLSQGEIHRPLGRWPKGQQARRQAAQSLSGRSRCPRNVSRHPADKYDRGPPAVTSERALDVLFCFVAGAGFEPATSGL